MSDVVVQQTVGRVTVNFGANGAISGASTLTTLNRLTKVTATGTIGMASIAEPTAGNLTGVASLRAASSSGLLLENSNGDDVLLLGAGPSQGITAYGQINGTSIDSTSASGVITRAAATQDAIRIIGRAGGTSSYIGTITPATLTASRTWTMPDATGTVPLLSLAQTWTAAQSFPDGSAASPGIRLTTEAHGLYRVGSTTLGITVAGTSVLTFASTGVMNLATGANGDGQFTIGSTAATTGAIFVNRATAPNIILTSGAGGAIRLQQANSATNTLAITDSSSATTYLTITPTGATFSGQAVSTGATSGIGYATGAGGTITQATSRTTGVTLNKVSGAITLFSTAGSTTPQSFTVTNSAVAATDTIILAQKSGTDKYVLLVTAVAAGSFQITAYTTGGTTSEAPVISFNVIKGVTA